MDQRPRLGGHDGNSLVVEDENDTEERSEDRQQILGRDVVARVLVEARAKLHQLLVLLGDLAVLLGITLSSAQIGGKVRDETVKVVVADRVVLVEHNSSFQEN